MCGIVRICCGDIILGMTLPISEKFYVSVVSLLYNILIKISFSRGVSLFLIIILASRSDISFNPRVIFENFGDNYCLKYPLYGCVNLFFNSVFSFHDSVFPGVDLSV